MKLFIVNYQTNIKPGGFLHGYNMEIDSDRKPAFLTAIPFLEYLGYTPNDSAANYGLPDGWLWFTDGQNWMLTKRADPFPSFSSSTSKANLSTILDSVYKSEFNPFKDKSFTKAKLLELVQSVSEKNLMVCFMDRFKE